jgi:hypothetical protein
MAKVNVGDIAAGTAHYEQCVPIARSAGALEALVVWLAVTANGHVLVGDRDGAVPFAFEAVSLARELQGGRPVPPNAGLEIQVALVSEHKSPCPKWRPRVEPRRALLPVL